MIEEDSKTLWCGNLSDQVTEELLYELFLQAGPLEKVRIPRDRDGRQKTFAFVTYCHDVSVSYAIHLFRGTSLFHKTLSLQSRSHPMPLPPPIRCSMVDQSFDNINQVNVRQQFEAMTDNLPNLDQRGMQMSRQSNEVVDRLTIASLQGNWSHRHHPYRNDDRRHQHQGRDHGDNGRHRSQNWRDRDRRDERRMNPQRNHKRR